MEIAKTNMTKKNVKKKDHTKKLKPTPNSNFSKEGGVLIFVFGIERIDHSGRFAKFRPSAN